MMRFSSLFRTMILFICATVLCVVPSMVWAWGPDTDLSAVSASFWGEDVGDKAGWVSCAGDMNGDGYDDFLIGTRDNDDGGIQAGQAYLVLSDFSSTSVTLGENLRVPASYRLSQNFPNPFNSVTEIRYQLPEDSHMELAVFDVLGCKVKVLADGFVKAVSRSVVWDAEKMGSGPYFVRMEAGDFIQVRKMVVLR